MYPTPIILDEATAARRRVPIWLVDATDGITAETGVTGKPNMSKNGGKVFWSMPRYRRMFLIFGSETQGLPESIRTAYGDMIYKIPISRKIRSLNLSTAVGIVLYESLRPEQSIRD